MFVGMSINKIYQIPISIMINIRLSNWVIKGNFLVKKKNYVGR